MYLFSGQNWIYGLYATNPKRKEILERQILLPQYCNKILALLKKEPKAYVFLQKVTKKEAPNYFEIIKYPMDLGTMGKKICLYKNLTEFKDDLDLIWNNCLTYNVNNEYYKNLAKSMREIANNLCSNRLRVYPAVLKPFQSQNIVFREYGKERLKKYVSEYLKQTGFEATTLESLNMLVDYFILFIDKQIIKCKKNNV